MARFMEILHGRPKKMRIPKNPVLQNCHGNAAKNMALAESKPQGKYMTILTCFVTCRSRTNFRICYISAKVSLPYF